MEQSTPKSSTPVSGPMDRRKFLGTLSSLVVAGLAIQVIGCVSDPVADQTAGPGAGNCNLGKAAADRTASTITGNHGHAATVTTAQQDAGTPFNLSIQGSSGHNHTLSLTSQDLADLKAGALLTKTSSNTNGHTHDVTFAAVTSILRPC